MKKWYNPLTWFRKSLDTSADGQVSDASFNSFIQGEGSLGSVKIQPKQAYDFYESIGPLSDSVRKIAGKVKTLSFGIKDKNDKINYEHELIKLINNPGEGCSGNLFKEELVKSFLLTSELCVVALGSVDRPPLALKNIRPYDINITLDSSLGIPSIITTSAPDSKKTFYREERNGYFRFVSKDRLSEFIYIVGEKDSGDEGRGHCRLAGIVDDLEQLRSGKRHNRALLSNGAKPSIVAQPTEGQTFTPEIVKQIAAYFKSQQQGPSNAGNVWVQSKTLKLDHFGISNLDMDYSNLQREASHSVYNAYDIPLALVSADTMTMDNYKIAVRSLYTEAVFPAFRSVIGALVDAIGYRYRDLEGSIADFDPLFIEAMRETHIDQMVALRNSKSVTINEARRAGGYEDVPGGNAIMVLANELPLMIVEGEPSLPDSEDNEETDNGDE